MRDNLNLIYDWMVDEKGFLNEFKCMVLHFGILRQLENIYIISMGLI
jgi:hypothetical protein